MKQLIHNTRVYIPQDAWTELVHKEITKLTRAAGGGTRWGGQGTWVDGEGNTLAEDVWVYEWWSYQPLPIQHLVSALFDSQQSVLVVEDEKAYLWERGLDG